VEYYFGLKNKNHFFKSFLIDFFIFLIKIDNKQKSKIKYFNIFLIYCF